MYNPYFSLIRTVWSNAVPWRRTIVSYYLAFIVAQCFMSLSPYAFGRTIDLLQNFTPDKFTVDKDGNLELVQSGGRKRKSNTRRNTHKRSNTNKRSKSHKGGKSHKKMRKSRR